MFSIEGGELYAWPRAAICSTGPSGRPCARCPGWRTSMPSAVSSPPSRWCRTTPAWPPMAFGLADLRKPSPRNNRNDGAGRLDEGEEVLLVRSEGAIRTLDDLAAIVVGGTPEQPVRVADIGRGAALGPDPLWGRDPQRQWRDGRGPGPGPARGQCPGGGRRGPGQARGAANRLCQRASASRSSTTAGSWWTGPWRPFPGPGGGDRSWSLVLLVLFLGDLRAALTVALILPAGGPGDLHPDAAFGLSANLMSLGGLAIAIGMLVDAAVVVVENVVTQLRPGSTRGRRRAPAAPAPDLSGDPRGGGAGVLRHPASSSSSSCRC